MNLTRKCTSLQYGEQVVFNLFSDIYKRKVPETGSVEFVDANRKIVHASYMEGYKECFSDIPFEDMFAVYNPNAPVMKFENISGESDLLIPE